MILTDTIVALQLPGRKSSGPGGWAIQAKLQIYLWLGLAKHKKHLLPGIPKGYEMCYEFRNIERPLTLPPTSLHYTAKQVGTSLYQYRDMFLSCFELLFELRQSFLNLKETSYKLEWLFNQ